MVPPLISVPDHLYYLYPIVPLSLDLLTPLTQWLLLGTLLALVGTAVSRKLVDHLPALEHGSRIRIEVGLLHTPRLLAAFLLALCLARAAIQLLSFMLPGEPIDMVFAKAVLTQGVWGHANLLQTGTAALLFAATTLIRTRPRPVARLVLLSLPLLLWSQSGMGHAVDQTFWVYPWGRLAYTVHLAGAGIWLGTLAIVALVILPPLRLERGTTVQAELIIGFSRWARGGVLLVAASGITIGLITGGTPSLILSSEWGRLLLLKVVLFLATGTVGLWNWRIATPRLELAAPGSVTGIRRAIWLELILGAAVLALTSVLIGTSPPTSIAPS